MENRRKPVRRRTYAPTVVCEDAKPAKGGMLLGYALVSKGDEWNNAVQAKALRAANCKQLFEEAAPAAIGTGPSCAACSTTFATADTVVAWNLDRLSGSLKAVVHIMERIAESGAGFRSITESIDSTTRAGRMMMRMVAAFAEFERAMIRERTAALAAAWARGELADGTRGPMRASGARSPKA